MNTSNENDEFDYLRQFAADPASGISQTAQIRSEARLEQILVSPPEPDPIPIRRRRLTIAPIRATATRPATPTGKLPQYGKRPLLRWIAIPVAAAAIIVAGIVWPHNPVTPAPALTAHAALATWQPVPDPLTPERYQTASGLCRGSLDAAAHEPADQVTLASEALVIAEQRGDWVFLVYAAQVPGHKDSKVNDIASCLVWFPQNSNEQGVLMSARLTKALGSSLHVSGNWGETPMQFPGLPSPQIISTWGVVGDLRDNTGNQLIGLEGLGSQFSDGTAFQSVIGHLDGAVSAFMRAGDTVIVPSISGDWFAAWWPVTQDNELLAEIIQCRADWWELERLGADKPNNIGCPTGHWEYTPQLNSITLTQPDGVTTTYAAGAEQETIQQISDAVAAARAQQATE